MPSAALQRGVVKQVLSGDTIILRGKPVNGPPPERVLSFASVAAPRLSRVEGETEIPDEPFAFASREWLRKYLVGKEVSFKVEYTTPSNREHGYVFLGEENIVQTALSEGWLKLREKPAAAKTEEYEALQALENTAKAEKKGLWADKPTSETIRSLRYKFEGDGAGFVQKYKGKPCDAIVEQIRDGTTLRVLLVPTYQMVTIFISGIKSPQLRKNVPNQPDIVEPFAEEAKYFTESRLLQRDIQILFEGVNQNNVFIGSVLFPAGNIAEALVKDGLARVVDWMTTMVTGGVDKLRAAERFAKEKKLRIWKDYQPKENTIANSDFTGRVIRIISPDTILVRGPAGEERRITLSSVRAPRAKEPREDPYRHEAQEFLRQRLIGKTVSVHVEFVKPAQDNYPEKHCATVRLNDVNVAEMLLTHGLGGAVRHRDTDEDRSSEYDKLLAAEKRATDNKKGIHNPKDPPTRREPVDVSKNSAEAKKHFGFLQRAGRVPAVVEYVFSGSRFRILVEKENVKIAFNLAGVRTPRTARDSTESGDPFAVESVTFATDRVLQHDVEIEVESLDKQGSYVGSLFSKNGDNLAALLLSNGLATIHNYSADSNKYANDLYSAERIAKVNKIGLWVNYDEEAAKREAEAAEAAAKGERKPEFFDCVISEIVDGAHFFIQIVGDGTNKLQTLMEEIGVSLLGSSYNGFVPKVGELCAALFSHDNTWYRARVRKVYADKKQAEIFYLDYGNSQTIDFSHLRDLPIKYRALEGQAQECYLTCLKSKALDDDYGLEAAERLRELALNKDLVAQVDERSGSAWQVTLFNPAASKERSINQELLEEGLTFVERRREKWLQPLLAKLQEHQDVAFKARRNIWRYGDFQDDE